jgi:NAD(P)-dependent dehydrogenase (short-subunit alcohol dehydrogenase family)
MPHLRNTARPRLDDRVVLVTGASRGLGAELVRAFLAAGARVSACARSAGALDELRAEMEARGFDLHTAVVDVTRESSVERWVAEAESRIGAPGVLINNASVLGERGPLAEADPGEWRTTIDVNLTGSFLATRAVLPAMLRARSGSIVQLSSGAAVVPRENWGAYSVSKLAADGFAMNLAAELAGTGIRVNSVDPGAMRTGMRADAYPDEDPDSLDPPAARTGIFLWLASPASEGVTGQRLSARDWAERHGA